jgi:LPS sulfotransferase NodH
LLSEALEFTLVAGRPREYFEAHYERDWFARLGIAGDHDYIAKFLAAGTTPNGVFGAKIHWHQFVHLRAKLGAQQTDARAYLDVLRATFPDLRFIFLTRRDKVLQGVSYYRAQRTDRWHSLQPEGHVASESSSSDVAFDFAEIDRWVTRYTEDERRWSRFFEAVDVEPIEVVYEDLVVSYSPTVRSILDDLKIAMPQGMDVGPPRLRKLGDRVSDEWADRYRTMKWAAPAIRPMAERCYFIATTPRTGGFLLAEALESTDLAGRPREYFDHGFKERWCDERGIVAEAEYFRSVAAAGTTPNGVFGAKVLWHQFEYLLDRLRRAAGAGTPNVELLRQAFPGLRYIFLTRRDKIRQAISYDRAIRSGIWWSVAEQGDVQSPGSLTAVPPPFDFAEIDYWVTRLTQFEAAWRRHFKRLGVVPFEVAYEDLADNYDAVAKDVLAHLDLSPHVAVAAPRLQKQADEVTEEWVDRYRQINEQT